MSRSSLAVAVLWLACGAALGAEAPSSAPAAPAVKLVFTYPCAFAYSSGKPYEERVMDWVCDYIHASLNDGAAQFNALPTLASQKESLRVITNDANAAHNAYIQKIAKVVEQADPAKLPKDLGDQQRLEKLGALRTKLAKGVLESAAPFLWPRREAESYVEPTNGSWPDSWLPYMQPILERNGQLMAEENGLRLKLAAAVNAGVQQRLKELSGAQSGGAVSLQRAFDGVVARKGGTQVGGPLIVVAPGSAKAGAGRAPAVTLSAPPKLALDAPLRVVKPPAGPAIPTDEGSWEKRNYFSRGVKEGVKRLQDEATIAVWHATGQTKTIGRPAELAALSVRQEGPSCAVGAQYEAMRARGMRASLPELAAEARDKGYYSDLKLASGDRMGGTSDDRLGALLADHGVKNRVESSATEDDLLRALQSGGAIVIVHQRVLWNDPSVPESASHAVYVTGAEVDAKGSVRGYYINDTGTGEGGRFVGIEVLRRSWRRIVVSIEPAAAKKGLPAGFDAPAAAVPEARGRAADGGA